MSKRLAVGGSHGVRVIARQKTAFPTARGLTVFHNERPSSQSEVAVVEDYDRGQDEPAVRHRRCT